MGCCGMLIAVLTDCLISFSVCVLLIPHEVSSLSPYGGRISTCDSNVTCLGHRGCLAQSKKLNPDFASLIKWIGLL